MHTKCVFCAIINRDLPATIIQETSTTIVIQDRSPKAPIHYLIIPKKHLANCLELTQTDQELAAEILYTARQLGQELPDSHDFRLIMNTGAKAGQTVFHIHAHFLAGKQFGDF